MAITKKKGKVIVSAARKKALKSWAKFLCADLYCRCKKRGGTVTLREYVDHVNRTKLGSYHGLAITSSCVNKAISLRNVEATPFQRFKPKYMKTYIYFQRMKTH